MSRVSEQPEREDQPEPEARQVDDVYRILSNRRRRYTLHYLLNEETTDVRTLAEQIAAWEHNVEAAAVTYDQRRSVYNSLQQSHLSKLQETGLVVFDKRAGTVTLAEDESEVSAYLGVLTTRRASLPRRVLLVGGFWVAVLAGLSLYYPTQTVVENVPVFGLVALCSMLGVTLVHHYRLDTVPRDRERMPPTSE